jgi:hypothetical protein
MSSLEKMEENFFVIGLKGNAAPSIELIEFSELWPQLHG